MSNSGTFASEDDEGVGNRDDAYPKAQGHAPLGKDEPRTVAQPHLNKTQPNK